MSVACVEAPGDPSAWWWPAEFGLNHGQAGEASHLCRRARSWSRVELIRLAAASRAFQTGEPEFVDIGEGPWARKVEELLDAPVPLDAPVWAVMQAVLDLRVGSPSSAHQVTNWILQPLTNAAAPSTTHVSHSWAGRTLRRAVLMQRLRPPMPLQGAGATLAADAARLIAHVVQGGELGVAELRALCRVLDRQGLTSVLAIARLAAVADWQAAIIELRRRVDRLQSQDLSQVLEGMLSDGWLLAGHCHNLTMELPPEALERGLRMAAFRGDHATLKALVRLPLADMVRIGVAAPEQAGLLVSAALCGPDAGAVLEELRLGLQVTQCETFGQMLAQGCMQPATFAELISMPGALLALLGPGGIEELVCELAQSGAARPLDILIQRWPQLDLGFNSGAPLVHAARANHVAVVRLLREAHGDTGGCHQVAVRAALESAWQAQSVEAFAVLARIDGTDVHALLQDRTLAFMLLRPGHERLVDALQAVLPPGADVVKGRMLPLLLEHLESRAEREKGTARSTSRQGMPLDRVEAAFVNGRWDVMHTWLTHSSSGDHPPPPRMLQVALAVAAREGHVSMLKMVLEVARVHGTPLFHLHALVQAVQCGALPTVEVLLNLLPSHVPMESALAARPSKDRDEGDLGPSAPVELRGKTAAERPRVHLATFLLQKCARCPAGDVTSTLLQKCQQDGQPLRSVVSEQDPGIFQGGAAGAGLLTLQQAVAGSPGVSAWLELNTSVPVFDATGTLYQSLLSWFVGRELSWSSLHTLQVVLAAGFHEDAGFMSAILLMEVLRPALFDVATPEGLPAAAACIAMHLASMPALSIGCRQALVPALADPGAVFLVPTDGTFKPVFHDVLLPLLCAADATSWRDCKLAGCTLGRGTGCAFRSPPLEYRFAAARSDGQPEETVAVPQGMATPAAGHADFPAAPTVRGSLMSPALERQLRQSYQLQLAAEVNWFLFRMLPSGVPPAKAHAHKDLTWALRRDCILLRSPPQPGSWAGSKEG